MVSSLLSVGYNSYKLQQFLSGIVLRMLRGEKLAVLNIRYLILLFKHIM